jgi:hypothetical protein
MPIKTPDILPGEPGWEKYIAKKKKAKEKAKAQTKKVVKKAPKKIGNIEAGGNGIRIGREVKTYDGRKKYPIWRYRRKIGEISVDGGEESQNISLSFVRMGAGGNHRHLIQDVDFQKKWDEKEEELLRTQEKCHLCSKKISKTAKPNLFHYNLFKKKTQILERADKVPEKVVSGKLTLEEGWKEFNDVLEDGNRYYMSLKETALICHICAKSKGLNY